MNTREHTREIAGLTTTVVEPPEPATTVILLHGYAMQPSDLAPFAHSMGMPARFVLPRGPFPTPLGGYAWWDVDTDARERQLQAGPRDLAQQYPAGVDAARARLERFLEAIQGQVAATHTVVGGFSQGGMLACDFVLRGNKTVDGLVLLSASRIAFEAWQSCHERLRDLPAYVSHGQTDTDLAFAAGVELKNFLQTSGAEVSWVPFDSGHEIPLVVWRGLRKFLTALLR